MVFRLKKHPDGTIARHKARLVAKGYHQTEDDHTNAREASEKWHMSPMIT
ncbi:hypothetical protein LINPERPRIM_LOCUS11756, partial [Linum perenne]